MIAFQVGSLWQTTGQLNIMDNVHIKVLNAAATRILPKGTLAEIRAVTPQYLEVNCKDGATAGIHAWGLKLQVQRAIWGTSFQPVRAALPPTASSATFAQIFAKLSQRQRAVAAGMGAMREAREQLQLDIATGYRWGTLAVMANAALLPLNIIINAFDAKAATSLYQAVVKELYAKLARSGTRIDGKVAKESLSLIKKAVVEELKRKGLMSYVPGVNIIVGMAEDATALIESMSMLSEGSAESKQLLRNADSMIDKAMKEFIRLGVEMDRLLTEADRRSRTA